LSKNLKYAATHEWIRIDADGLATVGISEFAQESLGDVVFVELPQAGAVEAGQAVALVESVKTASDIHSPVAGDIVAVNAGLQDAPELLNGSPLDKGWLFRLKVRDAADLGKLLDEAGYMAIAK
jgi:glycine cleavage system H protein